MFSAPEVELLNQAVFENDGVICIRGALADHEVDKLRDAVDRQCNSIGSTSSGYDFEELSELLWQGQSNAEVGEANRIDLAMMAALVQNDLDARPLWDKTERTKGGFLYDAGGWRDYSEIREVAFDSRLPRIAAKLMGAETVNFWEDATFVKLPFTKQRTAFHQDHSFFQIEGTQCVVVWIPLDHANLENGVTQYVRGSHKWEQRFAPNTLITQTALPGALDPKCPDIEGDPHAFDLVSFDVNPGDVIIHHVMTVHGAGGNSTDRCRRAISFRYCGDKVRYYDRPGSVPQASVQNPPRNGDRLHSEDFPMVYPKPWPGLELAPLYKANFLKRHSNDGNRMRSA